MLAIYSIASLKRFCVFVVFRSQHQLAFHSAFERATARVVYRQDWETQRPLIMQKNKWESCPGEVLIS